MQTSSVQQFNATFNYLEISKSVNAQLQETGATAKITPDMVLDLASSEYCKLC
jgi:hypothetical protein